MRKVIVSGADGQLGKCILRRFAGDEVFDWVGLNKQKLNILNRGQINELLDSIKPEFVVNTAAYTAVDKAESDEFAAIAVNVEGVKLLAEACRDRGVKLIHISTDYVFSGEDGGTEDNPYTPFSPTSPTSVYGNTKLNGEKHLQIAFDSSGIKNWIIRTGWLYDNEGSNFLNTMRRLGSKLESSLKVVVDQVGTPTWTGSLAVAIRQLMLSDLDSGVYHYSDMGVVSWHGFAEEIFKVCGLNPKLTSITTSEYPTDAVRPQNSHLGGSEFAELLGLDRIHWKEALRLCIEEERLWDEVQNKAELWSQAPYDENIRAQVRELIDSGSRHELIEAFHKDMEFGTGGMRGVCGPGTNRINVETIAAATQGLANYLKKSATDLPSPLKVAIAYDCRLHSVELSRVVAEVLAANGIEALLYHELRPTPQLSFTVSHLGCAAGVVITASHNPPEYNGFKVYYKDGGQITAPHDQAIIDEFRKVGSPDDVQRDKNGAGITILGPELDEAYRKKVLELRSSESLIEQGSDVCLVYTGLHGTGAVSVPEALKEFGFKNLHVVKSQSVVDGNFSTVLSPNPEEPEALNLAIQLAEQLGADLVMGTDPDSDRVGLAVPGKDGKMVLLNGNETGALLFDYVLSNGNYSASDFICSTVVTSPLLEEIGKGYGVGHRETLTGFKFIAAAIADDDRNFVVGGEESYGYLVGDTARDKDGVSACCVLSELAHELKLQNLTMLDKLEDIHRRFNLFQEGLVSVVKTGRNGAEEIKALMAKYRENVPKYILGEKVVEIRDFSNGTQPDFPKSDVIQFITEHGSRVTVRPSGTEPKIKYYASVNTSLNPGDNYDEVRTAQKEKVEKLLSSFSILS